MISYLCCELTARDLDSRILIAAHLLRAGHSAVVGQAWGLFGNREIAPKGTYLFATANRYQAKAMAQCKAAGHHVCATDEEGLVFRDENLLLGNIDADSITTTDLFMFQDHRHEETLRKVFPSIRGRVTGNARVELLRQHRHIYRDDAKDAKAGGRYVLINSNLSMTNSTWGTEEKAFEVTAAGGGLAASESRQAVSVTLGLEKENRATITTLVKWMVTALKGYRIVVRPHPTERADTWKEIGGVEVISGTSAIPWMLGAELVIHTGSTTGLEAALLGVPCLNVGQPDDRFVIDQMNCSIFSIELAKEAIVLFLMDHDNTISGFQVPRDSYIPDGAKSIAGAILSIEDSPSPNITTWGVMPRTAVQQHKFSATTGHFAARVQAICAPLLKSPISITVLDDSIFLLKA